MVHHLNLTCVPCENCVTLKEGVMVHPHFNGEHLTVIQQSWKGQETLMYYITHYLGSGPNKRGGGCNFDLFSKLGELII